MAEKVVAAVLFLVSAVALFGQSLRTEAKALLMRGEKTAVYSSDEASFPYHMRVTFALASTPSKMQGLFLKDYLSHEFWRERYELGGYLRVGVRNGKQMGEFQSDAFQPVRLDEVRNSLPPVKISFDPGDTIKKIKNTTVDGLKGKCVEYRTVRGATHADYEVCFNLTDGTPQHLRQETLSGPCAFGCGLRETEWSDYASFRDKLYPRHVVVKYRGTEIIRADVVFSEGKDLIPAAFDIPGNFESGRACEQMSPPMRIHGKDPDYPRRIGQWAFLDRMLVQAKIGFDGRVQDAQAVRNPAYAIQPGPPPRLESGETTKAVMGVEKAFVDAVKQWSFEPAKCDGVPMVENILIPFNAELH